MKTFTTRTTLAFTASVSLGCAGVPPRVSAGIEPGSCPTPVASRDRPLAPGAHVASIDEDAESNVRRVAEGDLHCSEQQVYVRRAYDVEEGGAFEFYAAERCGSYQVYRVPADEHAAVRAEGVDIFLVSPVSPPRMVSLQPYARPPTTGEALLLLDGKGVVCRASVGKKVADQVWTIDNCSSERVAVVGVVAIRATEATSAARLEAHWIGELARSASEGSVAPWSAGGDSMWKPFTVVDLSGDRTRQVAVYCRRSASDYECERFMVTRARKDQAGWFVPVARARWTPGHD